MEYRNAKRTAAGLIDCEINHPEHGWIPFTADPADTGATFDVAALVARIEKAGEIAEYVPPAGTVAEVKAEAGRRIEAIMPAYKQRNFFALQAELSMTYGPDPKGWPADMQALAQEGLGAWAQIKAIRVRSNEIEALDPIPADYTDDKYWP